MELRSGGGVEEGGKAREKLGDVDVVLGMGGGCGFVD